MWGIIRIFHADPEGWTLTKWLQLANQQGVIAIVDASHPYAASLRANARSVADQLKIPYLSWIRPPIPEQDSLITSVSDHDCCR